MNGRAILKGLGYAVFFVICFFVAFVMTFPFGAVRMQVEHALSKQLKSPVGIGEIGLKGPNGIEMREVALTLGGKPLKLDRVAATAAVVPLMSKKLDLSFEVEALGGLLRGEVQPTPEQVALKGTLSELEVGRVLLEMMGEKAPKGVRARSSADFDLKFDPRAPHRMDGQIALGFREASWGGGEVKGFTLPPMDLGNFGGEINIQKGRATFKDLAINSADLEASLDGTLKLDRNIANSVARWQVRAKPTAALLARDAKLKSAMELAAATKKVGKDGALALSVSGPLRTLRAR